MPTDDKIPKTPIHIHLLKSSLSDATEAISTEKTVTWLEADDAFLPGGCACYMAPPAHNVGWTRFLKPAFNGLPAFQSKHASAVLFFNASNRIFAVTFGYGRSLLKDGTLVADFGLKTALNMCKPETIRALDYRTIEDRTRIGRVQIAEESAVGAFRLDPDTDLMRGIEAKSNMPDLCDRLAARWASLTIWARKTIVDMPSIGTTLLALYAEQTYKSAGFSWVDNIQRIIDTPLLKRLDDVLRDRLDVGKYSRIRLAVPEIIGHFIATDVHLFKSDGPEFDSNIAHYLESRPRKKVKNTVKAARDNHKVFLNDTATGSTRQKISVYRCIIAEIELNDSLYLLADGEWFELNRDYVTSINKAINSIPRSRVTLPSWNSGEWEADYNLRAANSSDSIELLDKKIIMHGGGASRIEPADLITSDRTLCYVKRRDKSSSGLSHLFAQGEIAATLLRRDVDFRRKVAKRIPNSLSSISEELIGNGFEASGWTVAFIILGADTDTPGIDLPFFSRVNLKKHADRIAAMNWQIAVGGV